MDFKETMFIVTPTIINLVKQLVLIQIIRRDLVQKVFVVFSDFSFIICTRNELLDRIQYGERHY